jgi:hypothetical protein
MHPGGRVIMTRGLAQYLGLDSRVPTLGLTPNGSRRRGRRGSAVPGQSITIELDDLSLWTVSLVGTLRAFENAYFVDRPAPKIKRAWTSAGTELVPRRD